MGTIGTLWAFGAIDLPFLNWGPRFAPGTVMVPVSGMNIPAYTQLTRDHVFDLEKRQYAVMPMAPEAVTPEMIVDKKQIFGRVLDHDKPKGYAFTEKDFLPKGTRAGLVAGIPAGKRSMTIEAGKLGGVFGLKVGDHLDLLASVPFESKNGGHASGIGGTLAAQQQLASAQKRASVRVLAQDAVIVSPVTSRNKPTTSNSLTSGTTVRQVPVQEIVIAVAPGEVAPISEAIATKVEITCVARSGLPDDPGAVSQTPGANPLDEMKVIDSIRGIKRDALVFSNTGSQMKGSLDDLDGDLAAPPAATSRSGGMACPRPRPRVTNMNAQ
ncbi:MAG TPA: hypothetical protein VMF30_17135 [Pirellulales bacterium]|nr:hypothetical protein [Pirellulales bacterium]